ncbi:hypothetical protein PV11_06574 [Exophiala sideris]|uniref:SPX domain-containing protein n=1 Tax=Exophiala sideris TaxID=1016849 RepID=A0A0D1Y7Y7_9EURO|nr:hypothetical protein PV11_06574 [Exophiala sideris]
MKFGDTLSQRSVPKWTAYNVNYNELKHLIKNKTSAGAAGPRDIPTQGRNKWEELENQLCRLLGAEYDNVTLFLRSKQGEIERRLAHLEKQIKIAQRAVQDNALDKPVLQARKYRQMLKDIEGIGDEIQSLSRFANVQKTAFRKILKKYRKWTGSTSLQTRLDVEVFSSKKLQTDFSDYLQQLAEEKAILTEELAEPMLTGRTREPSQERQNKRISASAKRSPITQITESVLRGPLAFDAAILTVPYGEASGSAFYWIHPDNLDEARTILLRHMRDAAVPSTHSTHNSETSIAAKKHAESFSKSNTIVTHMVVFDNAYRFVKDTSTARPSRIALGGHWSSEPNAVVTLAGLSPTSSGGTMLTINRQDLPRALQRQFPAPNISNEIAAIQNYLTEHRDVKPLAEVCSTRNRYVGITNTADVGNWATLDTSVTVAPADLAVVGEPEHKSQAGDAFPYAILHIRWEFARTPAVVRAFDESHLVERVNDFTIEDMAVHSAQKDLPEPSWQSLLDKDIRKVPILPRISRPGTANRTRLNPADVGGTSSGPSSTEGPAASIFSAGTNGQSSATSDSAGASDTAISKVSETTSPSTRKKKRARIVVPERSPPPTRYWNEFDDPESEYNQEEGYVIYVNPDESTFPGAETVSKAFEAISQGFNKGKATVISWLPPLSLKGHATADEQAPLLVDDQHSVTNTEDADTSSSETDEQLPQPQRSPTSGRRSRRSKRLSGSKFRAHQLLTPRQKMLERTLFYFYTGLIAISYILLVMSSILLGTGRRKAYFEVDAGVLAGVISAETCAVAAMILIMMRKQRLSVVHWGLVAVMVACVVVIGVALIALIFAGEGSGAERKGSVDGDDDWDLLR